MARCLDSSAFWLISDTIVLACIERIALHDLDQTEHALRACGCAGSLSVALFNTYCRW
jgi:hypothetical protein